MQNIVLIGFMGCGKSTLARELGRVSGRFVLDSDMLIEQREGISVAEYFAHYGEEAFREREREFIDWVESSVHGAIISTGGGMSAHNSVKPMGIVVYLDMAFERICTRLSQSDLAKRPLFGDRTKALELFTKRQAIYQAQADITLNAELEIAALVSALDPLL